MERVCPYCRNDDARLMEPRVLWGYTLWFCLICAKTWSEPKEHKSGALGTPQDFEERLL